MSRKGGENISLGQRMAISLSIFQEVMDEQYATYHFPVAEWRIEVSERVVPQSHHKNACKVVRGCSGTNSLFILGKKTYCARIVDFLHCSASATYQSYSISV